MTLNYYQSCSNKSISTFCTLIFFFRKDDGDSPPPPSGGPGTGGGQVESAEPPTTRQKTRKLVINENKNPYFIEQAIMIFLNYFSSAASIYLLWVILYVHLSVD